MSKIVFGTLINMLTVATPSSGYAIGYDLDGILKQKDQFGVITNVGGTGSGGGSGPTGATGPIGATGPMGATGIGMSFTASNGLTMSSGILKLGGSLIETTNINVNNNSLIIGGGGNFYVNMIGTASISGGSGSSYQNLNINGITSVGDKHEFKGQLDNTILKINTLGGRTFLYSDIEVGGTIVYNGTSSLVSSTTALVGVDQQIIIGSSDNEDIDNGGTRAGYISANSNAFGSNSLSIGARDTNLQNYINVYVNGTSSQGILSGGDLSYFRGIEYDDDYSANFTEESLITKRYLLSQLGTSSIPLSGTIPSDLVTGNIEFQNGLISVLSSINGNDGTYLIANGQIAQLLAYNTLNGSQAGITLIGSQWSLAGIDTTTGISSTFYNDSNGTVQMTSSGTGSEGITGNQDFSSNYQPNSFVQKVYVDSLIGSSSNYVTITSVSGSNTTNINNAGNIVSIAALNSGNNDIGIIQIKPNRTILSSSINNGDNTSSMRLLAGNVVADSIDAANNTNSSSTISPSQIYFETIDNNTGFQSNLSLDSSGVLSLSSNDGNAIDVSMRTAGGLVGASDYTSLYNNLSFVQKIYVDGIYASISSFPSKFVDIRGFTSSITQSITHNLNTNSLIVQNYDSTGLQIIDGSVSITGTGSVDITFSQTLSNVKTIIIG